MIVKKINYDYLKITNELLLLLLASLIKEKKNADNVSGRVLIINTCLIGDFIVSIPAIRNFIENTNLDVDLVVSPSVKSLAERIKGVKKVYTAKSSCSRNYEIVNKNDSFGEYEKVIVMKISKESYKLLKQIKTNEIQTSLIPCLKYMASVSKDLLLKKKPRQFRDLMSEMLQTEYSDFRLDDLFNFEKKDFSMIKNINVPKGKSRIIVIHTSAPWKMKKWKNESWVELITKINKLGNFKFVFVGGNTGEKEDYQEISSKLKFKTYSLINKLDLKGLMLFFKRCDYFIGIDSGPRNLANLADLRSITLLGNGFNIFMPPSKKDIVIDASNGGSASQLFFRTETNHMQKIETNQVYNAFQNLIEK